MIATVKQRANLMFPETLNGISEEDQQLWAGGRPMTPDDLPIVSPTKLDNLFVASGGGSYGWRVACGMGELVAQQVHGTEAHFDSSAVSLNRF